MIRHIVFWKFRPDADPEPFLQALSALPEQIDWIRGMHVARSAAPNAAWDAALEVDFDTLEDVARYRDDPPQEGLRPVQVHPHRPRQHRYPAVSGWWVYILRCGDGTLYTGMTDDPERRLAAHRSGHGAKYTRGRGPLELVYSEACGTRGDALRREAAIKRLPRAKKLRLIKEVL